MTSFGARGPFRVRSPGHAADHPSQSWCEALYAEPADPRGPEEWGRELGMSERTLARRLDAELGMSFRSWRRRLRVFKATELLRGGLDVTRTAMELGYGSTSAFVYAFRSDIGRSPQLYMRGRTAAQGASG